MIDRSGADRLDGKVALVTGAARGQGRSHAVALAELGAAIAVLDVPAEHRSLGYPLGDADDLAETVRLVESAGARCLPVHCDVRDPAAVGEAVARVVDELGSVDVACVNHGIVSLAKLWEVTDDAWRDLIDTNLTGVFHVLRAVTPVMRDRGWGRIVVTASMGGRMGIPEQSAYNASKWGVIGLAKSLALEVAKDGITVNVVAPCTVATPMVLVGGTAPSDDLVARAVRVNPIPEPWIEASDVTRAVLHLVLDPGVVSGAVMEIGLGSSARLP